MKNFEKIVPAVAMSLVVAGFGAADAAAADTTTGTTDIQNDPVPTAETPAAEGASIEIMTVVEEPKAPETTEVTENTETKAPETTEVTENTETKETEPADTEITDVDQVTEGQETPEDSTVTETALLVNPTVEIDENGNPVVTNQGTLKKEESTTTVKNEDGSTNTRTTDNITGPITAPATGPSEEDVGNVKGDIEEIVNGQVGNGSFDKNAVADAIKNKYGVDSVTSSGENGKYTFTFQTSTTAENTPLNPSELAKVLGVDSLTPTDAENYTYTDKDGNTVTVKVIQDGTTTTIVTDWTVTVTEDTTQGTDKEDVTNGVGEDGSINVDFPNADNPTWTGGLNKEDFDAILESAKKETNATGNNWEVTVTYGDSNDQYKVSYKASVETLSVLLENEENLTAEYIYNNLLSAEQKALFELNDGKVTTKDGQTVSFKVGEDGITMTTYTYTVTKVVETTTPPTGGGSGSTGDTGETEESKTSLKDLMEQVMELAKKDAVLKAVNAALGTSYTLKDVTIDGNWTTVTVNGTSYGLSLTGGKWTVGTKEVTDVTTITDGDVPLADTPVKGEITATVTVESEKKAGSSTEAETFNFQEFDLDVSSLKGLKVGDTFRYGETQEKVIEDARDENGQITFKTRIENEDGTWEIRTYTFKTETTTSISGPTEKYEEEKMHNKWDSNEGAWIFDFFGDAFVVKQSGYAFVWCANPNITESQLDALFGKAGGNENGDGSYDKMNKVYLIGKDAVLEFILKDMIPKTDGSEEVTSSRKGNQGNQNANDKKNLDAKVVVDVINEKVYVYGKEGKEDGLSHFDVGGTITTTDTLKSGQYTWEKYETVENYVSGTGEHTITFDPETTDPGNPGGNPDPSNPEKVSGTLTGTKYKGDLDYSYTIPATNPETTWKVNVKAEAEEVRNVDVEVESSVTVPPEDGDNNTDNPGGDPDPERPTDPTDPGDRPSRPTNPDRDRPTNPPTTEITDPEVPLAETPEEPTAEIPDGDVPLAEIPEEDVPLADTPDVTIPDGDVPLAGAPGTPSVTIPDGSVPLADVPKTGDVSPLWSFSAILSALGLGVLLKKRKED